MSDLLRDKVAAVATFRALSNLDIAPTAIGIGTGCNMIGTHTAGTGTAAAAGTGTHAGGIGVGTAEQIAVADDGPISVGGHIAYDAGEVPRAELPEVPIAAGRAQGAWLDVAIHFVLQMVAKPNTAIEPFKTIGEIGVHCGGKSCSR